LKIFRRGKDFEYNGPRERNGIVSYVLDQVSPPSTEILSKKEYKKILEKGTKKGVGLGLIAFFTNPEDELIVNYADAANDLREDFAFHHVNGQNVAAFGGKNGHLRLSQPAHLQSKFEQKVKAEGICLFVNFFIKRVTDKKGGFKATVWSMKEFVFTIEIFS
jgi:protein disulfide-isomerase A4